MSGPEDEINQAERRRILREGTTFHQRAVADASIETGRFTQINSAHVVGSTPIPRYPALPSSSPWSGAQPEPGIEPPLGLDNPALEPSAVSLLPAEQTAPAGATHAADNLPPASAESSDAGASFSQQDESQ